MDCGPRNRVGGIFFLYHNTIMEVVIVQFHHRGQAETGFTWCVKTQQNPTLGFAQSLFKFQWVVVPITARSLHPSLVWVHPAECKWRDSSGRFFFRFLVEEWPLFLPCRPFWKLLWKHEDKPSHCSQMDFRNLRGTKRIPLFPLGHYHFLGICCRSSAALS